MHLDLQVSVLLYGWGLFLEIYCLVKNQLSCCDNQDNRLPVYIKLHCLAGAAVCCVAPE